MSNFAEPWVLSNYYTDRAGIGILTNDNDIVVVVAKLHDRELLSRIVECVNVFAGIENPREFMETVRLGESK